MSSIPNFVKFRSAAPEMLHWADKTNTQLHSGIFAANKTDMSHIISHIFPLKHIRSMKSNTL
jgi:hypothetical protein